jgi:hypothetical protein
MGAHSFDDYLSQAGILHRGVIPVAVTPYTVGGMEFVRAHVLPGLGSTELREIDLNLTLKDFDRQFPDSDVLFTRMGRGK